MKRHDLGLQFETLILDRFVAISARLGLLLSQWQKFLRHIPCICLGENFRAA